ncbi:REG4, partial [Cervus elaphus hippelaphus]
SYCYGYFRKLRSWSEAEEASTIAKYIGAYQRNKPVWIGLQDPQKKHQWQWVDGAVYAYRSLSGKSVGENKYCAVMNAK